MKRTFLTRIGFFLLLLFSAIIPSLAIGIPVTTREVPAYYWYHGCGPTSAASIFGHWDLFGYPNLFTASGMDVFLTANVQDQISSPEHNAKYDSTPDDPSLPTPPKTSIADWYQTSVDPRDYGGSYISDAPDAFIGYAAYRGYTFSAWNETFWIEFTWQDLVAEINADRPMRFSVDSNGDGETDHSVPVLGYDDRGAEGLWYGFYTTWSEDETIRWERFRMPGAYAWGIGVATFVHPVSEPLYSGPEPSTMLLLGSGLIGLWGFRKKFKK